VQILPITKTSDSIFDQTVRLDRRFRKWRFKFGSAFADVRKTVFRVIDEAHMTNPRCWAGVVTLMFAAATPALAQQQSAAGRIKMVSGSAFVVRQGAPIPAQIGQFVFEADGLRTGADGKIGITLKDDTRVSLGPSSEVRLERFIYAPADGALGLVLKFVQGAAAYVSGRIAKLAPDSIRLETPAAIVGVRGTSLAIRVQPQ
jgi:FecR protein